MKNMSRTACTSVRWNRHCEGWVLHIDSRRLCAHGDHTTHKHQFVDHHHEFALQG